MDFPGFAGPLLRLQHRARGARSAAQRAQSRFGTEAFAAAIDGCGGLDHGAWARLLYAYPDADVPVVQLSVQPALGPGHHLAVGRALQPLADEGVLIVGSGHLTHNLRDWDRSGRAGPAPYAREFQQWVFEKIRSKDLEALSDYRSASPHGVRAHPTDEHFLPLFVALGAAAQDAKPQRVFDAIESGA